MKKPDLTLSDALKRIQKKQKRLMPCLVVCFVCVVGFGLLMRSAKKDFSNSPKAQTPEIRKALYHSGVLKFSSAAAGFLLLPFFITILIPTQEESAIAKHFRENENHGA